MHKARLLTSNSLAIRHLCGRADPEAFGVIGFEFVIPTEV